jgi:hypothetical protein
VTTGSDFVRGEGFVGWYLFRVDPNSGTDEAAAGAVDEDDNDVDDDDEDERPVNEDEVPLIISGLLLLPAEADAVRLMFAKGDGFACDADEGDVSDRRAVMIFRLDRTSADAIPDPL